MAYLENIRTFLRVYELGNMSAAARDLRISAAVASARISQLEEYLNVRLFQRTTRALSPTEQGNLFYESATKIVEAVEEAEAEINNVTQSPRGTLFVAAPIGLGQSYIAPAIPKFKEQHPQVNVRLRLSDRKLDLTSEGLNAAFFLGVPQDSSLKIRKIADCRRVLCASPDYIERRGAPQTSEELISGKHDCLNMRYPGVPEFQWPLQTEAGVKRFAVTGPFEADHGDVLTQWALDGYGIIIKPVFEISAHLASGRLIPILQQEPPVSIQLACLYAHRRRQDPKTRLFIDFIVKHIQASFALLPNL
ncbi:LysR family transcriptional regulator [Flexibacterium corallicola]|uniref:LysR family transcriptional regulator n=1 Tax=Flexibacterium corallicola TaxID=3037259 RepID=UPI00286EE2CD|nr:LysR family transcriptional regulator [Pseudovibrio sp. M1P-2-3]